MTTKKVTFTLAIYKIAGVKVTFYSIIYIYEQDQSQPKIANRFADLFYTASLHLGILFQIYDPTYLKPVLEVDGAIKDLQRSLVQYTRIDKLVL